MEEVQGHKTGKQGQISEVVGRVVINKNTTEPHTNNTFMN